MISDAFLYELLRHLEFEPWRIGRALDVLRGRPERPSIPTRIQPIKAIRSPLSDVQITEIALHAALKDFRDDVRRHIEVRRLDEEGDG